MTRSKHQSAWTSSARSLAYGVATPIAVTLGPGAASATTEATTWKVGFDPRAVTVEVDRQGDRVGIRDCHLRTEAAGAPDLPVCLYRLVIDRDLTEPELRVIESSYSPPASKRQVFDILPAQPEAPTFFRSPSPVNFIMWFLAVRFGMFSAF